MSISSTEPKSKSLPSVKEIRFFLKYFFASKSQCMIAFSSLIISTVLGLIVPLAIGGMVDGLNPEKTDDHPFFSKLVETFDNHSIFKSISETPIPSIAVLLVTILLFQAFFSYIQSYLFVKMGALSVFEMRKQLYGHIIEMPSSFFVKKRIGDLISRLSSDLTQVEEILTVSLSNLIREVAIFVASISMVIYISGKLAVVMLIATPVVLAIMSFFGKSVRSLSRLAQEKLGISNITAEESLHGILTVKAFSSESFEKKRYHKSLSSYIKVAIHRAKIRAKLVSTIIFGTFGTVVIVLCYGLILVESKNLSMGDLTAFIFYTIFAGGAVTVLSDLYSQFQKAFGIGTRLSEILELSKESLQDEEFSHQLNLKGEVCFENVSFSYPSEKSIAVLDKVSFTIGSGERVALVGPSGAGKSTITSLLFQFYKPTKGQILVDGKDISSYTLVAYRRSLAIVTQDVYLFGRSILNNITYGSPSATIKDAIEAAKKANAHDFIMKIPNQYDANVGERGIKLSGGQKQRIAIARAILRDPRILILDEATSSLDSESEKQVQDALEKLMRNRSSLIIAHRLSTIQKADKILVLKKGKIEEQGSHDELLKKDSGLYKRLSKLQFETQS